MSSPSQCPKSAAFLFNKSMNVTSVGSGTRISMLVLFVLYVIDGAPFRTRLVWESSELKPTPSLATASNKKKHIAALGDRPLRWAPNVFALEQEMTFPLASKGTATLAAKRVGTLRAACHLPAWKGRTKPRFAAAAATWQRTRSGALLVVTNTCETLHAFRFGLRLRRLRSSSPLTADPDYHLLMIVNHAARGAQHAACGMRRNSVEPHSCRRGKLLPQSRLSGKAVARGVLPRLATSVLVFWSPFHDPRVHESAPAGVQVTTVRALDESAPDKPVAYSLLDVKDHAFFHLNHVTGNLTTAKSINRKAGEKYEVKTLLIEVTVPNEHPPVFERALYRSEVHQTRTRPGYRVVQVRAHDADSVPYNAEVYYRLEPGPESTRALRYLALDGITGEVMLNRSLADVSEPTIGFTVIAEDGGSPKKQARTRVELQVKTISDPQNTRALVSNETSVRICWQRPLYGNVSGYVIKYKAASDNVTSFVNVTTEAMDKCTPVQGLRPWTEYEYRVYAWNSKEEGLGSPVDRFATRIDCEFICAA
ncbi:hypothetical protein IscW_ISCW022531 [Ixodes scapularis]|uniref:Uncharacterized protein n=1 Tax=Ixodes scapularis TaxID=6945 RepID=B7QCW7_IXOSC|nr:hypothetical protein IscW_ISCW022531 [Ixodes scapularis]|eukprot:XP_002413381.1 hypothetical protein IscW_ISCW022531 [Ixodes scapularis]